MKSILLATTLLLPMWVQYYPPYRPHGPYGGWNEPDDRRWPPTHLGPQMDPCIRFGECRGPRYEEDPEQSWRRPRRRPYDDRWE
jgi:hypothetical protein